MPEPYCPLADLAAGKAASSVPIPRPVDSIPLLFMLTVKSIDDRENCPYMVFDAFEKSKLPLDATSTVMVLPSPRFNRHV